MIDWLKKQIFYFFHLIRNPTVPFEIGLVIGILISIFFIFPDIKKEITKELKNPDAAALLFIIAGD